MGSSKISILGPEWTERVSYGHKLLDPLQFDALRNRMLTELLYGVVSQAITLRLRYFSYHLWCLCNIKEASRDRIVLLEKIYLLSNLLHESTKENPDYAGMPGELNNLFERNETLKSWIKKNISEFDLGAFQIHQGDSCGFYQYYQGPMNRLLLLRGHVPTNLGIIIAKEFENIVGIDFRELDEAIKAKKVPKSLLKKLGPKSCPCLINEEFAKSERDLLRKAFFYLIEPLTDYDELQFKEDLNNVELDVEPYLVKSNGEIQVSDIMSDTDEFIKRLRKWGIDVKTRASFLLYLWLIEQYETSEFGRKPIVSEPPEQLKNIRKLWRLFVLHEHFKFAFESILFSLLLPIKEYEGLTPKSLLMKITSNDQFETALHDITIGNHFKKSNFLNFTYDIIYFGEFNLSNENLVNLSISTKTPLSVFRSLFSKHEITLERIPNERSIISFIEDNLSGGGRMYLINQQS